MGTRYADENIGEITDDEVIFKSGEKYLLKEIRSANWCSNDNPIDNSYFIVFMLLVLVPGGIALFTYNLVAGFLYIPIAIWLFVKGCNWIEAEKHSGKIILYAKNGEPMFSYEIEIDGERFVEQLNRYIS